MVSLFYSIKRLLVPLLLLSLLLDLHEAAEESLSSIKEDGPNLYTRNATSSGRRLAQSNVQPKITITKGRYYNDVLRAKSLEIRFSVSEASWKLIRCYLQGPSSQGSWPYQTTVLQRWNPCPSIVNIPNFARDGSYTFTGIPTSEAKSVSATSRWIIDHTPPWTYSYGTCHRLCATNGKTFRFSAQDNHKIARYQCKLDDGRWFSCKSPYTVELTSGNETVIRTFRFRAIDEAGNVGDTISFQPWYSNNGSPVTRDRRGRSSTPVWVTVLWILVPILSGLSCGLICKCFCPEKAE